MGTNLSYTILGNGDGTFTSINAKASVGAVVAAGFLDGDTNLDVAGSDGTQSVLTAYGLGNGLFRTR